MPLPRYLLDEEEQDPFLTDNLDEPDDQPFDPNGSPRPFTAPPMRPFGDASPDMPEAPELSSPRSTVSPELQRIINANGPAAPPGNPPVIDEAQRRRKELADIQGQVPLQAAPKWWQRLGAGALGAAAGYTNAAKRTHVDPTAAVAGIMGVPDYQRKMAAHEAAVTGAQAQSNAANAAEAEWWKNRQLNNQERLQQAQEEQALAHGEYWRHQAEREQGQWKMNTKGILYNTTTGELHQPAATLAEKIADAKAAGLSPEEAKIYATGGKLGEPKPAPNVNEWQTYLDAAGGDPKKALDMQQAHRIAVAQGSKVPRETDPLVEELRKQRLVEAQNKPLEAMGAAKKREEDSILIRRKKELDALGIDEDNPGAQSPQLAAINRRYAPQLQAVQDRFATSLRSRQVAADDYDVNPDTLEYSKRGQVKTTHVGNANIEVPPATPAVPHPPQHPAVAGVQGTSQKPTVQNGPPKAVTDNLPPGRHTFANGQVWQKNADGSMVFVK